MKICPKCTLEKNKEEFPIRQNGKPNSWCKKCHNSHTKKVRDSNIEERNRRAQYLRKIKREELRQVIFNYLKDKGCITCGEADRVVLDFDHKDQKEKEFSISEGLARVYSKQKVLKEIEKCDVLCSNCHRRKTAKQLNWNK